MQQIITILSILILFASLGIADEQKKADRTVTLKYIEAGTAYETLKESFPEITEIVRRIQIDKNSLTIKPSHAKAAALRTKLAELDKRPKQILLSVVVAETTMGGHDGAAKDKILSRPSVFALEGKPTEIPYLGIGGEIVRLIVTASSIPASSDAGPKQIRLRSQMSLKASAPSNQPAKERVWIDYLLDKVPMEIIQYAANGKLRKITISARCVTPKPEPASEEKNSK